MDCFTSAFTASAIPAVLAADDEGDAATAAAGTNGADNPTMNFFDVFNNSDVPASCSLTRLSRAPPSDLRCGDRLDVLMLELRRSDFST